MDCQLENLPAAGRELSPFDRFRLRADRALRYVGRNTKRVLFQPTLLLKKAGLTKRSPMPTVAAPVNPAPLGLRAGDRVRVKSLEEVRRTLDEVGDYEGLGFMALQKPFCGGEYTVQKRVDHFFDERTRRMLKVRNTVILADVFCEPPADAPDDYAGCQRTCFLFWKEAWLERV